MNQATRLADAIKADAGRIVTAIDSRARGNIVPIKTLLASLRRQLDELERAA